jgi:hypothetical protein
MHQIKSGSQKLAAITWLTTVKAGQSLFFFNAGDPFHINPPRMSVLAAEGTPMAVASTALDVSLRSAITAKGPTQRHSRTRSS